MPLMSRIDPPKNSGFTIVELLLALGLSAMIVVIFVWSMMVTYLRSGANAVQLELNGNLQVALNDIERDVRYSIGYGTSLTSPFSDPNAPAGGWTHRGTPANANQRVLLLRSNTTVTNPFAPSRVPVYINGGVANPYIAQDPQLNCSTTPPAGTLYLNPQLPFYTVYFVDNGTLYRRKITDTTTITCNGTVQYQKTSCPTGSGGSCVVKDEIMATNVVRFSINYYEQVDTPIPTFNLLDPYRTISPDDLAQADNVEIIIGMQRVVDSQVVSAELSNIATRMNEQ